MPKILDDPDKEMDVCHTPLEARRREEMSIRRIRFGFFRVPDGPVEPIPCSKCNIDLRNKPHMKVNGIHMCNECYNRK